MQANSQHPGQWQNLHGSGDASGDGTFSNPEQNYYQKCLQPHSANHPFPGQITPGNYLAQFSCTILQTTAEKTVTIGQSTNEMKPSQENNFNSKCTQPTGQQNSQVVLWNVPNSVQIFVPVNNISMQETINVASHNNGQNILHFASRQETFSSNSRAYMQQQTTSLPAGTNNSQQFNAKTVINHRDLNDTRRDMSPCIMPQREQRAIAAKNLPKSHLKEGMPLPSDSKYCLPTENTPHGHDSSFGGHISHRIRTDSSSTHDNLQALSSWNLFHQNNTNKAVAVVTPLSPIEMASILNVPKKSAQVFDGRSVPGSVHHRPNISHPLEVNAYGLTMEEPNNPPSKHQQPMSGELTHNSEARPKSSVSTHESTNCQSNHASSPKLNSADGEQSKPASVRTQNEASENIPNNNHTVTDKKTNTGRSVRYSTIPVIEWPLEKLHVLINFVQQVEDGQQKNVNKYEPGKEILKLYWNGDVQKFHNVVDTGIYQNVLEEVYSYCPSKDDVILRQIKTDARNQVAEDFHVLKHNEDPPKMEYKSSWLNLNEKLDDIDRERGYSWYYRSIYGTFQEKIHEENSECKLQRKSLGSPYEPLPTTHQCPTKTVNVPEDGQSVLNLTQKSLYNESRNENWLASCNEQSVTGIDDNHLAKLPEKQTNCQSNMGSTRHTSSPELNPMVVEQPKFSASSQNASDKIMASSDIAVADKSINEIVSKSGEEVAVAGIDQMDTSASIEINASPNETSVSSTTVHCLDGDSKKVNASPKELKPSCLNTPQELNTTSSEEQITLEGIEEKAHAFQTTLPDGSDTPSVTENDQYMTETVCDVPAEEQGYLKVKENSDNESHGLLQEMIETDNCSLKTNSVATESNTVSSLKGITNLLRTLDKCDVSLRIYEHQVGKNELLRRLSQQPTRPSGMPVLNDRFCKGAGGRGPMLNNNLSVQSDITSSPRLSPMVKEHQAVMANKCHEKITSSERDQTTLPNAPLRTDPDLQPNTGNPLTGMETIVSALKKRDALLKRHHQPFRKQGISKRSHEQSDKTPGLTESAIQRDRISSAKLNSVVAEQHQFQNECNDEMLENAEIATCETVPKLDNVDASGSIKINVLPYEVAKRCFAGEMMEDLQEAVRMSESSRLNSSEKCDVTENNEKSHALSKSFCDAQEEQLVGSLEDNLRNSIHAARNAFQDIPLKPSQQDLLERKGFSTKESGTERLEDDFCNAIGDKIHLLTDKLSSQNDFTSPSKLNPEVEGQHTFEASSRVLNKFNGKTPNDDRAVTDENLIVPSPSTEVDEVVTEFEEIDAFASIKINVLPHEVAEKWFAGDTIENEDIAVHFSSKEHNDDQVEVEVLDYHDEQADPIEVLDVEILDVRSEKEVHSKNVKPKERNNQSGADVKLESFCCLTKWFHALKHEEGSFCMCQVKTDLNEQERKIQAHDTSFKLQKNEEDCVDVFSDNFKSMELKPITQTNDENASECTETKTLLISHMDMPGKSAEAVDTPPPDVKRPDTPPSDVKKRPDTPPLAVQRRPDTPPLAVQRRPDTPPLAVQRRPDTPPLAVQRRPDTPPLAVQRRPDTPPLAVTRRPDTPPLAVTRRPDTPPLAVTRRPDTPPLAVTRRPDTPPLAVTRRPDTPPLAVTRRPDTPPLAVTRRPDTPPLAVTRRPDTPPLAVTRRPDTPPLAVTRRPDTPPLAVTRRPDTPPLAVTRRPDTPPLAVTRRPDTPPLAVTRRPDTPPLAVTRRPDTPPLAVKRRPDTPPLAVKRRPDTPPLAVKRRPDTPPLAVKRRPDTPPLAVKRRPDTPPLAVKRRPDTPPLAVQRKPDTPPLAVQRKPDTPPLDVKRRSETVCLSLYGSSSKRQEVRNKRYINGCEEPPKTLEITISRHEISEGRTSKKRKWVESIENEDALDTRRKEMRLSLKSCDQRRMSLLHEVTPIGPSEVTKENALSSTVPRKPQNPSYNSRSGFYLAAIKKRKKKNFGTRQISMNNFIIRRKTVLSKSLQSPEPTIKSKYELGNPALMPLQEGSELEFKVLPSTFNFEDGRKPGCVLDQADSSSNTKNEISHSKNKKAKGLKTTNAPTPGTWCLSPLKTKHVQSTDVSGSSCTIFQEFKKKYHERKGEMVPTQNLNSN
nr:uncharacterized protein si:ch211-106e7.2 isoform X2 [Misgurnus anguillicaudatus]